MFQRVCRGILVGQAWAFIFFFQSSSSIPAQYPVEFRQIFVNRPNQVEDKLWETPRGILKPFRTISPNTQPSQYNGFNWYSPRENLFTERPKKRANFRFRRTDDTEEMTRLAKLQESLDLWENKLREFESKIKDKSVLRRSPTWQKIMKIKQSLTNVGFGLEETRM